MSRNPKILPGQPYGKLDDKGDITIIKGDGRPATQPDIQGWLAEAMADKTAWYKMTDAEKRAELNRLKR